MSDTSTADPDTGMDPSGTRFSLLGPFTVTHDGRPVDIGGPALQAYSPYWCSPRTPAGWPSS